MSENNKGDITMNVNLDDLLDAAKPLIKYLNDNFNPHFSAIITPTSVELVEGVARSITMEFVKD